MRMKGSQTGLGKTREGLRGTKKANEKLARLKESKRERTFRPLPGWFVKVIVEVMKGLAQVATYLDDVIVFDSDPTAHVKTVRALFECLRKHSFKLSTSKARLGATDAIFLGHSISSAGIRPNAEKGSALMKIPMPQNLKQVHALMGGVEYYRKFLPDLSKRIRPLTALLRKGVSTSLRRPWKFARSSPS